MSASLRLVAAILGITLMTLPMSSATTTLSAATNIDTIQLSWNAALPNNETPDFVLTSPDGTMMIAGTTQFIWSLSVVTKQLLWTATVPNASGTFFRPPFLGSGAVVAALYIDDTTAAFVAFNIYDGAWMWTWNATVASDPTRQWSQAVMGESFFIAADATVFALWPNDGSLNWQTNAALTGGAVPILTPGGNELIVMMETGIDIYAVPNGETMWQAAFTGLSAKQLWVGPSTIAVLETTPIPSDTALVTYNHGGDFTGNLYGFHNAQFLATYGANLNRAIILNGSQTLVFVDFSEPSSNPYSPPTVLYRVPSPFPPSDLIVGIALPNSTSVAVTTTGADRTTNLTIISETYYFTKLVNVTGAAFFRGVFALGGSCIIVAHTEGFTVVNRFSGKITGSVTNTEKVRFVAFPPTSAGGIVVTGGNGGLFGFELSGCQ